MLEHKTILLVEDNKDDEELTLRALRKHRLANNIVVARDGQQALDYLFAQGDYADRDKAQLPHIVMLDLKLPKISGLDVLKAIRSEAITRLLPVVILTSSNEHPDITTAYELGGNGYVRKPVSFDEFMEAVGQLGLYWLLINENPR
jgi:two-component system response regulator